jgi:hypothetical protein
VEEVATIDREEGVHVFQSVPRRDQIGASVHEEESE